MGLVLVDSSWGLGIWAIFSKSLVEVLIGLTFSNVLIKLIDKERDSGYSSLPSRLKEAT